MLEHYYSHWHKRWGTIPPSYTNTGALLRQLTPNDGALFLPLTPMMGHYSSN
ncbi:unnamed protein product [Staurois parvus]|uniref:Uncharacterized protein n=1 Tax=Staurois parvus TaxID=386267 RepID=A0ABN9ERM1_9NEOB|nr:unnamed protein product [Staurois parvus]